MTDALPPAESECPACHHPWKYHGVPICGLAFSAHPESDACCCRLVPTDAPTAPPPLECSLLAHMWFMGNVDITTEPDNLMRCGCGRVAWVDRQKLIEVHTGYKCVYGGAASRLPPTRRRADVSDNEMISGELGQSFLQHVARASQSDLCRSLAAEVLKLREANEKAAELLSRPPQAAWQPAETVETEHDILVKMFRAYQQLKALGWCEIIYCPKDGAHFDAIEAGSTGVHDCNYTGEWPNGYWWVYDGDQYPSHPILFKLKPVAPSEAP